jgi:Protein of unknown function (DUF1592)/Protein of unknown function (DUF1588)/Protein of unknown function (DUF1595)/Protein of unknown function (DUF1587)/Protein of unknown function (DUF1585)
LNIPHKRVDHFAKAHPNAPKAALVFFVTFVVLIGGCVGNVTGSPRPGATGAGDTPPSMPTQPSRPQGASLRRMTHFEFNNVVRDLLETTLKPAQDFSRQEREGVFDNDADNLGVSSTLLQQYLKAAEDLAVEATTAKNLPRLLPCQPLDAPAKTCVRTALAEFAARAYRRPLTEAERDDLLSEYNTGFAEGKSVEWGLQQALMRVLVSPYFLFWVETGSDGATADSNQRVRLSAHQLATRLARLTTATLPDTTLRAAADADQLRTPQQLLAQAKRLLRNSAGEPTANARSNVDHFHSEWLGLSALDTIKKTMPEWNDGLRVPLRTSTERFVSDIFWERRDVSELLAGRFGYVNEKTAALFGMTGIVGDQLQRVEFPPNERAGLLTQPGLLALLSNDRPRSIHRAKFILAQLMCSPPNPPPATAPTEVPAGTPGATYRERFNNLTSAPDCVVCHAQLNGIGFGVDDFDALGRRRSVDEQGVAIDTRGELVNTDVDGPFRGAVELGNKLAQSAAVRTCVVRQWFRYANGRFEKPADEPALTTLEGVLSSSKHIEDVLLALIASDDFATTPSAASDP